jgi:hypothetical protein
MIEKTPGRNYAYEDPTGSIGGIRKARLRISKRGTGTLNLDTVRLDLANAQPASHRVAVQVVSGAYDQTDSRIWDVAHGKLRAQQ